MIRWKSEAFAFDTRWLPSPIQSGYRGATAIESVHETDSDLIPRTFHDPGATCSRTYPLTDPAVMP